MDTIGRGPEREQIDGGDPTFRVALEYPDGRRDTVEGCELMESTAAHEAAHALRTKVNKSHVAAICVVNERTGIARDRISWAKPGNIIVRCPDCGLVEVKPDVFDGGKPASGKCGVCGDRLYFSGGKTILD